MADRDSNAHFAMLAAEEYRALREEIRLSAAHTYTALQWGTAVVVVLVAAATTQWGTHHAFVLLAFFLIVPFMSCMIMLFWLGELAQIGQRARFLRNIELKTAILAEAVSRRADFVDQWRRLADDPARAVTLWQGSEPQLDPMTWERWLANQRVAPEPSAVTDQQWVYQIRLILFPLVSAGSLAIGYFYMFANIAHIHAVWRVACLAGTGSAFSVAATWIAYEIATDILRFVDPRRVGSGYGVLRRFIRKQSGRVIGVGGWND